MLNEEKIKEYVEYFGIDGITITIHDTPELGSVLQCITKDEKIVIDCSEGTLFEGYVGIRIYDGYNTTRPIFYDENKIYDKSLTEQLKNSHVVNISHKDDVLQILI